MVYWKVEWYWLNHGSGRRVAKVIEIRMASPKAAFEVRQRPPQPVQVAKLCYFTTFSFIHNHNEIKQSKNETSRNEDPCLSHGKELAELRDCTNLKLQWRLLIFPGRFLRCMSSFRSPPHWLSGGRGCAGSQTAPSSGARLAPRALCHGTISPEKHKWNKIIGYHVVVEWCTEPFYIYTKANYVLLRDDGKIRSPAAFVLKPVH